MEMQLRWYLFLLLADVRRGQEVDADAPLAVILLIFFERLFFRLQLLCVNSLSQFDLQRVVHLVDQVAHLSHLQLGVFENAL